MSNFSLFFDVPPALLLARILPKQVDTKSDAWVGDRLLAAAVSVSFAASWRFPPTLYTSNAALARFSKFLRLLPLLLELGPTIPGTARVPTSWTPTRHEHGSMVERLFAALYHERGWAALLEVVRRYMRWLDEQVDCSIVDSVEFVVPSSAIARVSSLASERGWSLPHPDDQLVQLDDGRWQASLALPDCKEVYSVGSTKQEARQLAALSALAQLGYQTWRDPSALPSAVATRPAVAPRSPTDRDSQPVPTHETIVRLPADDPSFVGHAQFAPPLDYLPVICDEACPSVDQVRLMLQNAHLRVALDAAHAVKVHVCVQCGCPSPTALVGDPLCGHPLFVQVRGAVCSVSGRPVVNGDLAGVVCTAGHVVLSYLWAANKTDEQPPSTDGTADTTSVVPTCRRCPWRNTGRWYMPLCQAGQGSVEAQCLTCSQTFSPSTTKVLRDHWQSCVQPSEPRLSVLHLIVILLHLGLWRQAWNRFNVCVVRSVWLVGQLEEPLLRLATVSPADTQHRVPRLVYSQMADALRGTVDAVMLALAKMELPTDDLRVILDNRPGRQEGSLVARIAAALQSQQQMPADAPAWLRESPPTMAVADEEESEEESKGVVSPRPPVDSMPAVAVFDTSLIMILREGSRDTERVLADVERRANRHLVDNAAVLADVTPHWVLVAARVARLLVSVCRQRMSSSSPNPSSSSLRREIDQLASVSTLFARVFVCDTVVGRPYAGAILPHDNSSSSDSCPPGVVEYIRGYMMLLVFRVEEALASFERAERLLASVPAGNVDLQLREAVELGILSAVGKADHIASHDMAFFRDYLRRYERSGNESSVIRTALVAKIYDVRLGEGGDAIGLLTAIPSHMLTDQWRVRLVRARNRDRSSAKQELLDELPADDRLTVEGRRLRAELLHGASKQGSAEIDSLLRQLRTFPAPVLSFIQYRKAVLIKKDRRMLDSHRAALDLVQAASKDLDRFYGQVAEHVQLNTILSTTLHGTLFKWLQPPSHGSNRRLSATCMRYGWAVLRAKRGAKLNDSVATLMQTELERRLHASTGPSAARDLLEFRILCAWPITLSSFQADWLSEFFERASPRDLVCVLLRLDSDSADGIVNTITDERRKADSIEELALRRRALDACWVDKARSGERLLLALIVNVQLSTLASDGIPDGVGSIWTGTVEDVLTRAAAAVADPPGRCHVLVGVDPVHWDMRLHQPTNAGGNFVVTSIPARAIKCTFDLDRLVAKDNMTALLEQGATSMIPLSRRREALQRGRIPR